MLENASGYSAEEILGMRATDFFKGEDIIKITAAMAKVFLKGINEVEANFVTKDGKAIPYFFSVN